ncbi:outer dynein arm-docking complex subunit 2-like [Bacillus rossius redtenbacheri]|uniref:outer dynein arm-docking complex subunit 2-like n=1 Tax=Bacillus rossius redtenbacheri TaxID=93214 RepID=UPI002FDE79B7
MWSRVQKAGDQTATLTGLCCMLDHDLTSDSSQLAMKDTSCLETLVNLLSTDHEECMLGSLKVLSRISALPQIQISISDMGGVQLLVKLLRCQEVGIRALAADTLAHVADVRQASKDIRRFGGIPVLMDLLDEHLMAEDDVGPAISVAGALRAVGRSAHSRLAMRRGGLIRLLGRAIKTSNTEVLLPLLGIIDQCASECAADEKCRRAVLAAGGLDDLAALLAAEASRADPGLLAAVAAAVWGCVPGCEEAARLGSLRVVQSLVELVQQLAAAELVLQTDGDEQIQKH